ncbi:ubiquinol-cytochrome-c reductase complex assembly factor 3 [Pelodiscus sinensis]|uniref:ubiquinol-cytochrome-c reductase complex assembly factor 3 n=1 Tax=Pelodiscus sinensis TaxID=13735 RepID=UPI000D720494|nr:ubiquinol-cytochrome-c reductase complex assembly factor 3-like [Pelodiscus sinensis]|eukprot:XP_025037970.1 ubiquinol-cytochrome-c reductase complex assembly factor 3-like [Pelodiscus sinensis]
MVTFRPLRPPTNLDSVVPGGFHPRPMEFLRRLVLGSLVVAGTTGVGVGILALIAPREQRRLEELQETTPLHWAKRRHQNELVMAAIKEAAETDENVARRPTPWSK